MRKRTTNRIAPQSTNAAGSSEKKVSKMSLDEFIKKAQNLQYSKTLNSQTVYDPTKNTSQATYTYSTYERENILSWLKSPSSNEKNLRNASIHLYNTSMYYNRLINYYASLYLYQYVISPLNFDSAKASKKVETYRKQYLKVANSLELMNIPEMVRNIFVVALREGAYYGVRWEDNNSIFLQKINADYCKITSVVDGIFRYSVDMSQISSDKLIYYPPEFTEMYNQYKADGVKWQEVPASIAICIKADPTIIDYSLPTFASVLPNVYTIKTLEDLVEVEEELKNYKMVYGKIPIDDDGQPIIPWDLVLKYYHNISNALGDRVGLAVSPFDLTSIEFENSGTSSEVDSLNQAIEDFWASAGTSVLIHGGADSTSGTTKLSIKNDESYMFGLLRQMERWINYYLKTQFSGTYKFKITFLHTTIFNREEMLSMYKEAVAFGVGKSAYIAATGTPQFDIEGLAFLENNILNISDNLTPLINSHNASSEELGEAGRPTESDNEIDDSGEATRDSDANENR